MPSISWTATGIHVGKKLSALEDKALDSPVNDAPEDGNGSDNNSRNDYLDAPEDRDNGTDYNLTEIS